jgi:hypothetical protein
VKYRE